MRRFDIYEDTQIPGVGGTYIGTTRGNSELPESVNIQCEANARLIKAAPDLLYRLQSMVDLFERDDESNDPSTDAYAEINIAKLLIAEVTGDE